MDNYYNLGFAFFIGIATQNLFLKCNAVQKQYFLQLNFQTVPCVWHANSCRNAQQVCQFYMIFEIFSMIDDCIVMLEETRCSEFFV